jgi:hypothetical protein
MTDPQPSGDYGYDLVHEDLGPRRHPEDQTGRAARTTSVPGGQADRDEDLSYDEAHDF